jgi:hypothetical protein
VVWAATWHMPALNEPRSKTHEVSLMRLAGGPRSWRRTGPEFEALNSNAPRLMII